MENINFYVMKRAFMFIMQILKYLSCFHNIVMQIHMRLSKMEILIVLVIVQVLILIHTMIVLLFSFMVHMIQNNVENVMSCVVLVFQLIIAPHVNQLLIFIKINVIQV